VNVVAAAAGIGAVIEDEPLPDMPTSQDDWKTERRRAVTGASRRPGDEGWQWEWTERGAAAECAYLTQLFEASS
jgi:hypothetical protein